MTLEVGLGIESSRLSGIEVLRLWRLRSKTLPGLPHQKPELKAQDVGLGF